jgi:hypothetical protein
MVWLLAFQQCEKHWETTRSKWNALHPRNREALAQNMLRWQKCGCCSVHLWRLGMVAGKLNQTPNSLNSTGKRELLEILRIWILQVSSFSRLLVLCPIFRHQTRSINLRHMQCSVTPINKSYIVGYGPMDIQSYPKYIPNIAPLVG